MMLVKSRGLKIVRETFQKLISSRELGSERLQTKEVFAGGPIQPRFLRKLRIQTLLTGKDTGQKQNKVHTTCDKQTNKPPKGFFIYLPKSRNFFETFCGLTIQKQRSVEDMGPITSDEKLRQLLKEQLTQNRRFTHVLLPTMSMEALMTLF